MKIIKADDVCIKNIQLFYSKRYKLPLRLLFQRKNFHAFCVGTPKSGTHSIANLFNNFRTMHEQAQTLMIYLMNRKMAENISDDELKEIFKASDINSWLEMDSSHYNGFFIEQLYSAFNQAQYILTIRDCISWLDSWFNHQLSREQFGADTMFGLGRRLYYDRGHDYSKHDQFLKELNLFPVRAYLEFWFVHNAKVMQVIPEKQLIIVKTKQISSSASKLANFLAIDERKINQSASHSYKARAKHHILEQIDKHYLLDLALEICGDLHEQHFPENSLANLVDDFSGAA